MEFINFRDTQFTYYPGMSINTEITDFVTPWRLISGSKDSGSSVTCLNFIHELSGQNIIPYSLMMRQSHSTKHQICPLN
jgi:hypothetical protein